LKKQNKDLEGLNATELQAQEIVDEIKELLVSQFKKKLKNEDQVHHGIQWNECQTKPITGNRYKWAICIDYNLCEYCEVKSIHEHIFIKIK